MSTIFAHIPCLLILILAGCFSHPDFVDVRTSDELSAHKLFDLPYQSVGEFPGGLLLTDFESLSEFEEEVGIAYTDVRAPLFFGGGSSVELIHRCRGKALASELTQGVSEGDFNKARDGDIWDRISLALRSPYAVMNRRDMQRVEILGRRRPNMFGEGDGAFYDLAEAMVFHIMETDAKGMTERELSEKGYLNTFNHITAQAFMTSLYSERLADFVADVHERHHMPELITGALTEEQRVNIDNGAVDNYLDMINNEWGQELGKALRKKYDINERTQWSPELLADYLNDIQLYLSWVFGIGFEPFRVTDELVLRFAQKINIVKSDLTRYTRVYH